jgi:hypothetical protein
MTSRQQRELIKEAYKRSTTWAAKVDKMNDNQVFAIFTRFKREGKI